MNLVKSFLSENGYTAIESNVVTENVEVNFLAVDEDVLVPVFVTEGDDIEGFVKEHGAKMRSACVRLLMQSTLCKGRIDIVSLTEVEGLVKLQIFKNVF